MTYNYWDALVIGHDVWENLNREGWNRGWLRPPPCLWYQEWWLVPSPLPGIVPRWLVPSYPSGVLDGLSSRFADNWEEHK